MQPSRRALALTKATTPFVCRGCLSRATSQRRRTLTGAATPPPLTSPAPSGLAPLASRRLISVSGPDAAKYLQGVITANILTGQPPAAQTVRADQGFYAAFLTAPGRVLYDVFIYRDTANLSDLSNPDPSATFLVEVDTDEADRLQRHIKRYKLRAKFDVRILGDAAVWQAWDDTTTTTTFPLPLPPNAIILPDTRAPSLGHRFLTAGSAPSVPLPAVPEEAYRLRRYLHGIPEGQSELLREHALPLESNLDLAGAIDFRKGCYVGQELTIRTRHRGVVRKRVLPVVLYGAGQPPPDKLAYRPVFGNEEEEVGGGLHAEMVPSETSIGRVGKKGRSAGKWLRGLGNVGLALCRLEIMTDMVLPGETAAAGGYQEGDEFVVAAAEGQEVRIKAFVPEWMKSGLSEGSSVH